jgi:hypothetical protein
MTDEDGAEWIDAYYAVVEAPCLSAADAIAKCQFLALAMDGQDMGWFEEEKVIRQIAALAGPNVHPDAKLIELGRQFERAKLEARSLERERMRLHAVYEAASAAAGISDDAAPTAASRKIMRECGYRAATDAFYAKHGEVVRLMKAIHKAKATTLEGFAVKAAAVAFDQSDFEVSDPVPTDVAERQLYRLARDMAKAIKARGTHPDAKLLKLGEQYRAARQAEISLYEEIGDDESPETMTRIDRCSFAISGLSHAILAIEPKTVEGLRVVAKVWAGQHVSIDGTWPAIDGHPDAQAVHAVMFWLVEGGAA